MRKFLLSMALVLCTVGAMAQNALEAGDIVSSTTLNSSTTSMKIAIKNLAGANNDWLSMTNQSSESTLTYNEVFYWEPVENSTELFYLKKACSAPNEGYVVLTTESVNYGGAGKKLSVGTKENALTFKAVTPTLTGANELKYNNSSIAGNADTDNLVRFYNAVNNNWINCEQPSQNPTFRDGKGIGTFTIHNVYDMSAYKLLTVNIVKDNTTTVEYQLYKEGENIVAPSYDGYYPIYTATTKDATETQEITVRYIKLGQFYTINLTPGYTAADRAGASMYVHSDAKLRCNKITGDVTAKNVFIFEEGEDGNIYMKNVATQTYISAIGSNASQDAISADSETTEGALEISFGELGEKTVDGNTVKIIEIQPGNNAMLNCAEIDADIINNEDNLGRVVSFTPGNDKINKASAWYLTEVTDFKYTLEVGTAQWATVVLGFNATIPTENFKAYTIASEEDGYVTLEEVTGVLAANVPVIVNAPQGNYDFVYTTDEATVTTSGLQGTLYNKDITATGAYVLGLIDGKVGFGKATTTGKAEGTFTNNANKAYFVPTSGGQNIASYSFRFGEDTTGISEVKGESGNVKGIFDLTGRRVENITAPGIYVVNGKKVLVK